MVAQKSPDLKVIFANSNYQQWIDRFGTVSRGITLGSINVGSRTDFEAMNRAIAMRRLRPVIDRTFPFAEASLLAFRGTRAFRQGRDHAQRIIRLPAEHRS